MRLGAGWRSRQEVGLPVEVARPRTKRTQFRTSARGLRHKSAVSAGDELGLRDVGPSPCLTETSREA